MKIQSLFCLGLATVFGAQAQEIDPKLLKPAYVYTAQKAAGTITIDGKADEAEWNKAEWTANFSDISDGEGKPATYATRSKLLWDDTYVYLYVECEEPNVWATLKEHDSSIFQENALEVFIDPDDDNRNYIEFQINAQNTVWDLIMDLPYRNGGRSLSDWDIKGLQKAVHIDGTLNNPGDTDRGWSVELAFPIRAIMGGRRGAITPGGYWRMNISRVQRETEVVDGQYQRKTNAEGRPLNPEYWVWSPVGAVNLHMPERMGYIMFAEGESGASVDPEETAHRQELWKYYWVQEAYKREHGVYATTLSTLQEAFPKDQLATVDAIQLSATPDQFLLRYNTPDGQYIAIDHLSRVSKGKAE